MTSWVALTFATDSTGELTSELDTHVDADTYPVVDDGRVEVILPGPSVDAVLDATQGLWDRAAVVWANDLDDAGSGVVYDSDMSQLRWSHGASAKYARDVQDDLEDVFGGPIRVGPSWFG